ncbi:MAG: PTS sugar transporter subunit IIA [Gammaproteobacteria bacterium]
MQNQKPAYNGILLLTRGRQGDCLLESAAHILGEWPAKVFAISLLGTERRGEIEEQVREAAENLKQNTGGVLILCDLFGSTQANVAAVVGKSDNAVCCAFGLNLAMLLEAVNRRHLPLDEMRKRTTEAARAAVVC